MKALTRLLLVGLMSSVPFVGIADGQEAESHFDSIVAVIDFLKNEIDSHGAEFSQMKQATEDIMTHFDAMDQKRIEAFDCIRAEFENLNNLLTICEQQKADQAEEMSLKQAEIDTLNNDLGLRDAQITQLSSDLATSNSNYQTLEQEHDTFVNDTYAQAQQVAQHLVDLSASLDGMNQQRTSFINTNQSMHDRLATFENDYYIAGEEIVNDICGAPEPEAGTE